MPSTLGAWLVAELRRHLVAEGIDQEDRDLVDAPSPTRLNGCRTECREMLAVAELTVELQGITHPNADP
ncbi:MAG: hypothetical protein HYY17_11895 [Planctomycetes bacterium]|nr:hypothetical protein [Planctomycetota bacterium]